MIPLIDAKWSPIVDYEGHYLVDCSGRVMSDRRKVPGRQGFIGGKMLSPSVSNMGYEQVSLYKDSKRKGKLIHRLVAEAFVPNPKGCNEVNHLDGDKLNNHYSNLEWCTRQENALHSTRVLKKGVGSDNPASKLTEKDVSEIKYLLSEGSFSQVKIGELYGVTKYAIHRISKGYNWSSVGRMRGTV